MTSKLECRCAKRFWSKVAKIMGTQIMICQKLSTSSETKQINIDDMIVSHLICTLISENPGVEKLRSVSNLRKISVPTHLNFFSVHLIFFQFVTWSFFMFMVQIWKKFSWQTEKNSGLMKKNSGMQDLKFF